MKVTSKGQVTIPRDVREALRINAETEVKFVEENGKFYIVKVDTPMEPKNISRLRGIASVKMTTDQILELTRS